MVPSIVHIGDMEIPSNPPKDHVYIKNKLDGLFQAQKHP